MPSIILDRLDTLIGGTNILGMKAPCRVASTGSLTLSGTQTIDGVALSTGERVLVKDQASALDNGVYQVQATSWARTEDFDGSGDSTRGTLVYVSAGTVNGGKIHYLSSTGINVPDGSSSINFTQTLSTANYTPQLNRLVQRQTVVTTAYSSAASSAGLYYQASTAPPTSTQGIPLLTSTGFAVISTNNRVCVSAQANIGTNNVVIITLALFTTASTIAVSASQNFMYTLGESSGPHVIPAGMVYETAALDSTMTFSLYGMGEQSAPTFAINGGLSGHWLGGAFRTIMTIEEYST